MKMGETRSEAAREPLKATGERPPLESIDGAKRHDFAGLPGALAPVRCSLTAFRALRS